MKVHANRAFPVSASRLWKVAVEKYGDSETWDRSVHAARAVPDAKQVDGVEHSAFEFETSFGQLTVQILDVRRDGEGGVMVYTITEGLPGVVRDGHSTWTILGDGPERSTLNIDVVLMTNPLGTVLSPLLKIMFSRADGQMVDDLYDYLVTGAPSAAKKKAIAKRT
jgi:hypothetical protein